MHNCCIVATLIDFRGRTITPAGVKPQRPRVQNLLENEIPEIQESTSTILRILELLPELQLKALREPHTVLQNVN